MLLFLLTLNAEVISGDTQRQYSKPGAPIDMIFTAQKVDVNEISDVNISLKTTIRSGTVSVLITLDENLKSQANFQTQNPFSRLRRAIGFQLCKC